MKTKVTNKNTTVVVIYDKRSNSYLKNGNISFYQPEEIAARELSYLTQIKKVGIFKIYMTAISKREVSNIQKTHNAWVNRELSKKAQPKAASVVTMLKNKGF